MVLPSLEEITTLLTDNLTDPIPHIPGDLKMPFIGSTFDLLADVSGGLYQCQQDYGNVFKARALGKNIVGLMGPEANKLVLHDDQDHFLNKPGWEWVIGDLFTDAIMLSDGEQHKRFRRIMQTAFHKQPMIGYLKVIEETVNEFCEKEINISNGKLLTYPAMIELVMQVAGKLFFGLKFSERHLKAITDVTMASATPIRMGLPLTKYRRGIRARRILTEFYMARIKEKKANPGPDMFSQMCVAMSEEGETFTDQEIVNQMIFVMMASHDTTTSTLTSMIYETARAPEWQQRMREEGKAFYRAGPLDYNRLKEFTDIGMVMNECLRMHPALVVLPRYASRNFEFNGYRIPAGTVIVVSPYVTHMMPEVFTDPERFDPERFNEERAEHKKQPFSFIPFGAGRHICIGKYFAEMEIKIAMSYFAQMFEWSVPKGYVMEYLPPLNHPVDGLPVRIHRIRN